MSEQQKLKSTSPSLLTIPSAIVDFLNAKVIEAQANTTTWLIIGAIIFQILSALLTTRIAALVTIATFFTQLVPTLFVSTGLLPNKQLEEVAPGKTTALFPTNADGSKGTPSGRGLALLIIGIRISHPLGILAPGAKQTGDFFQSLVATLEADKASLGYLGGHYIQASSSNTLSLMGYFDSMASLHAFAHAERHREAWNWWNKNVKSMPHLGVYHEAYDVPAHHWEAVYLQTPKMGLGAVEAVNAEGELEGVLTDARKGVWRTSNGRLGRGEREISETDPYARE